MGNLTITPGGRSYSQEQLDDSNRRQAWEHGQIDYLGIDSFELIQAKLEESMTKKKPAEEPTAENVAAAATPAPAAAQAEAPAPPK